MKVLMKGNSIEVLGNFLGIGKQAPDFRLATKDLKTISLKEYAGKKKVLATVPSVDTPTCAMETKKFNNLAKANPDVIFCVISKDLPFAQTRFCSSEQLANVVLLSDMRPGSTFGRDYGVLLGSGAAEGLLTRAIFVLDEHDKVLYSELVQEISTEPNYAALQPYLR